MKRLRKGIILSVLVGLLILAGTVNAGAQLRLEGNLNWPVIGGIQLDSSVVGSSGGTVDLTQYHLLLPDFRIYYQFGDDFLRAGIGARAYTVILLSLIYPEAFVEVNLKPIVLEASLGGWLFGVFGLVTQFSTANLLLPDLNVAWQATPWLRLGGGVLIFTPLSSTGTWGYIGYIGARFIFLL